MPTSSCPSSTPTHSADLRRGSLSEFGREDMKQKYEVQLFLPEPLVFSRGSTIPFKLRVRPLVPAPSCPQADPLPSQVDPPSPNPHPSPPLTPPDITFTLLLLSNLSPSSLSLAFAQFPPPGMVGALPGPGLVQAWNGDTEDTSVVECSNVEYRPPDFEPFTSVGRSEEARAFAGSLDVGGVCPSFEVAEIACAYVLRVGIRCVFFFLSSPPLCRFRRASRLEARCARFRGLLTPNPILPEPGTPPRPLPDPLKSVSQFE